MVLYSSGISLMLVAAFYLIYDVWRLPLLRTFFFVWGANAIGAYMLSHLLHFDQIVGWVCYGLEQYLGSWYQFTLHSLGVALIWVILWDFWRRGKFLRV